LSKYSLVAILVAMFYWGIYSAVFFTTSDPIHLAIGYYVATAVAITVSFITNKKFTFGNKGKIKRQYAIYIVFYALVSLVIAYFVFVINTAGTHGMLVGFFGRAISVTIDFLFFKFYLFRGSNKKTTPFDFAKAYPNHDPKKITVGLFVDSFFPYVDGVVMVVDNYARHLSESANVYVVVPKQSKKKSYDYNALPYNVITCASKRVPILGLDYPRPNSDGEFNEHVKSVPFDLVHLHSPFAMGKFACKIAKEKNIPIVATLHSQYKQDFQRFAKVRPLVSYLMRMIMKVFNQSDAVFSMSNACRQVMLDYGYKGPIHIIPNATEQKPIKATLDDEKYGLEKDQMVFIYVGRLYKQKNIDLSLDALYLLKNEGSLGDFKFLIVGQGEYKKRLEKRVKRLGLCDNVVFTGMIKDRAEIAALFTRADLFLFPSAYDFSSLVQIEAACFKTPTLFLEDTVTAGTVTNDINGFTAGRTPAEFAGRLLDIMSDKKKLKEIGENAHRDLYITWPQVTKKVLTQYKVMLQSKNDNA